VCEIEDADFIFPTSEEKNVEIRNLRMSNLEIECTSLKDQSMKDNPDYYHFHFKNMTAFTRIARKTSDSNCEVAQLRLIQHEEIFKFSRKKYSNIVIHWEIGQNPFLEFCVCTHKR